MEGGGKEEKEPRKVPAHAIGLEELRNPFFLKLLENFTLENVESFF